MEAFGMGHVDERKGRLSVFPLCLFFYLLYILLSFLYLFPSVFTRKRFELVLNL